MPPVALLVDVNGMFARSNKNINWNYGAFMPRFISKKGHLGNRRKQHVVGRLIVNCIESKSKTKIFESFESLKMYQMP